MVFNDSMNPKFNEFAYADDKVILIEGSSRLDLERKGQEAIDFMMGWCKSTRLNLSAEKSVLIQLKGKFDSRRPPSIRVDDKSLKMVKTTKYLGVDIDERLSTATHVNRVAEKAKKLSHALRRVARETWGLKPRTVKIIYKGAIENTLTYGAAGWASRLGVHQLRPLNSAQRSALIAITRSYKTTSTSALQVISGIIPIDIAINERVCRYMYRKGQSIKHGQLTLHPSQGLSKDGAYDLIRNASLEIWQDRWNTETTGRFAFEFIPSVRRLHDVQTHISGAVVQIITGHGKNRKYFQRFGMAESNLCDCGVGEQDIDHLLYECDLMNAFRENFKTSIADSNVNMQWPVEKHNFMHDDILVAFKLFASQIVNELSKRIEKC